MGFQIEINARVTVELRRESFILYVGDDDDATNVATIECDYRDVGAIADAVYRVQRSDRYLDDGPRRQRLALPVPRRGRQT